MNVDDKVKDDGDEKEKVVNDDESNVMEVDSDKAVAV